jgi:Flp pilus assembly protein TadD
MHEAQKHAQRLCELKPNDLVARRTLGRVYLAAGLQLNARRELERAAALDPDDEIVKNLLRELK